MAAHVDNPNETVITVEVVSHRLRPDTITRFRHSEG